jgi:excisionase family DNA binding protein
MAVVRAVKEERCSFFTPKTLAEHLSLSLRGMRRMLAEGVIPSYKIGGSRRIDPKDVDEYLKRTRSK